MVGERGYSLSKKLLNCSMTFPLPWPDASSSIMGLILRVVGWGAGMGAGMGHALGVGGGGPLVESDCVFKKERESIN